MQEEFPQEQNDTLPQQLSIEYIEREKEICNLPLHKSGLDLMSTLGNITACAMLIAEENLDCNPEIFLEHSFNKKRDFLINRTQKQKNIILENLNLELDIECRNNLKGRINCFLYDFHQYNKQNDINKLKEFDMPTIRFIQKCLFAESYFSFKAVLEKKLTKSRNRESANLTEILFELLGSEIKISKAFKIYKNLAIYLDSTGIDKTIFEKMLNIIEEENRIKYTTH